MIARRPLPPRGMALIAVLWIVAALAMLVAGTTQSVRQQIRVVAQGRDAVVGQAHADAAIQLALQALHVAQQRPAAMQTLMVQFGGEPIAVTVQPLNGLINIDRAPAPLLAALLAVAGGLPAGQAETLAQTLVDWRGSRPDGTAGPYHFEAIEDLLLIPGIDYSLFQRLQPLITTDDGSGGQVNPLAANADVLSVLAGGNSGRAAQIAAARDAGQTGIDTTSLDSRFVSTSSTERYRIEARVPAGEGRIKVFSRTVALGENPSGVPWRTLRTERRTQVDGAS